MKMLDIFYNFQLQCNNDQETLETFFKDLFFNYGILVNETSFYFGELELYYHKINNYDGNLCFERNKSAGEIFFHDWGFDICFGTNLKEKCYGGVLVRSLIESFPLGDNNFKCGPLSCLSKILNKSINNNGTTHLSVSCIRLDSSITPLVNLLQTKRIIGSNNSEKERNRKWRFIRSDLYNQIIKRNDSDYYKKRIKIVSNLNEIEEIKVN